MQPELQPRRGSRSGLHAAIYSSERPGRNSRMAPSKSPSRTSCSRRVTDLDGLCDQLLQLRRRVQESMSGARAEVSRSVAGGTGMLAGNRCDVHARDGLCSVLDLFLRRRSHGGQYPHAGAGRECRLRSRRRGSPMECRRRGRRDPGTEQQGTGARLWKRQQTETGWPCLVGLPPHREREDDAGCAHQNGARGAKKSQRLSRRSRSRRAAPHNSCDAPSSL